MDQPLPPYEARLVVSALPGWKERFTGNLALEAELGPRGGWLALGASGWALGEGSVGYRRPFYQYNGTAFLRTRWPLTATDDVGAVVGANHRYQLDRLCAETCGPSGSSWLILGLAWRHQTDRYWLHVTPQVELSWDRAITPDFVYGSWTSWGLPWVEGGWWVTPSLGLGLRFGPGLVQAVWRI